MPKKSTIKNENKIEDLEPLEQKPPTEPEPVPETEPAAESSDEEIIEKPKKEKKPYVFTEKRREAFAKARAKLQERNEKILAKKAELEKI